MSARISYVDACAYANSNASKCLKPAPDAKELMGRAVSLIPSAKNDKKKAWLYLKAFSKMKAIDPEQTASLVERMCDNIEKADTFPYVRSRMIHLISSQNPDRALKIIGSLSESEQEVAVIALYLQNYGKKDCPFTNKCLETVHSWNLTNRFQRMSIASAVMEFDFDYFSRTLDQVYNAIEGAEYILLKAQNFNYPLSQEFLNLHILKINALIAEDPDDQDLKLIKLELTLLRGMDLSEAEEWISIFEHSDKNEKNWSPRNEALVLLAQYFAQVDFGRALKISSMHVLPEDVLRVICKSITPEKIELAAPYFENIKNHLDYLQMCLDVVSELAKKFPDEAQEWLPMLVKMVEKLDVNDPGYSPDLMSDESTPDDFRKIGLMEQIIQICFDTGAIEFAEKLKDRELMKLKPEESRLKFTLMKAHYLERRDPSLAVALFNEALEILQGINASDLDHDTLREEIALSMVHLDPEKAIEITSGLQDKYNRNDLFFKIIMAVSKTDRDTALEYFEKLKDQLSVTYKVRILLKLTMTLDSMVVAGS